MLKERTIEPQASDKGSILQKIVGGEPTVVPKTQPVAMTKTAFTEAAQEGNNISSLQRVLENIAHGRNAVSVAREELTGCFNDIEKIIAEAEERQMDLLKQLESNHAVMVEKIGSVKKRIDAIRHDLEQVDI